MTTINEKTLERQELESLLPWHAAGTLSRKDSQRVEQALAGDQELAREYASIREELVETIHLNETLGAPSARAMQKLMADIEADASTVSRARSSFNLGEWLSDKLSSFSPRTLAWSATAAALAIVLQAGLLAGMFVNEQQGGATFGTASVSVKSNEPVKPGTDALISFAPQASATEIGRVMKSYQLSMVDGPSSTGMYKVRISMTGIPKDDLARILKQVQEEKSVVRFVFPAK